MRSELEYYAEEGIDFSLRNYFLKTYFLAHLIVLGVFYYSIVYSEKIGFYYLWTLSITP